MSPIVITTGQAFADIDAVACAIAYAELLTLEGKSSEVVLPGTLNNSVTDSVRSWGLEYVTTPTYPDAEYVLVDVSDPAHIADCAKHGTVTEVYDHHPGYELYWQEKIGERSHIEPIGAAATLIWEEFKRRGHAKTISPKSAQLLAIAILSNTLNFGAVITHDRDRLAYAELQAIAPLTSEWVAQYFTEQEQAVVKDVHQSIISDTKVFVPPTLPFTLTIGQLELWDGSSFLSAHTDTISSALESFGHDHWIMSIPSLSEKKNHFYTKSEGVKNLFSRGLGITFEDDLATSPRLWLRKEIIKTLTAV
jgi:inorganic pyrophosphatase/exopolyphosphatase